MREGTPPNGHLVRDATYDVLRAHDLTTLFSNPGSTEVPFLSGLPDDLAFVLALHEGSVVGVASVYAIGRGRPALVLLHTTAGLGNAVGALATAGVNRAPLVVIVGQGKIDAISRRSPSSPGGSRASPASTPCTSTTPSSHRTSPSRARRTSRSPAGGRRSWSCRWTTGSPRRVIPGTQAPRDG